MSPDERDAHLLERQLSSELVYQGDFLQVRRDTVALPDGHQTFREYIVHPGAVLIVPLLDDGRLLMERQHRYPLDLVMLEFPAGKIDPGEQTWQTAVRELAEETGYTASQWARAGRLHNAAAYSNEFIEIWFARGLSEGRQSLDAGELLELCVMEQAELESLAKSGELTDAKTLIALLWLQQWRAGHWDLHWQTLPLGSSAGSIIGLP